MQGNYPVQIEQYAEKYFIKNFEKKYKNHWSVTLKAIIAELERIDALLKTDKATTICDSGKIRIIKTEFKVATTKDSAHSSGNRCIVAWHIDKQFVSILLVYGKTDFSGHNETAEWKNRIKDNYPEYKELLK